MYIVWGCTEGGYNFCLLSSLLMATKSSSYLAVGLQEYPFKDEPKIQFRRCNTQEPRNKERRGGWRNEKHAPSGKKAVEQGHHIRNARELLCGFAFYDPLERYPINKLAIIHINFILFWQIRQVFINDHWISITQIQKYMNKVVKLVAPQNCKGKTR